MLVFATDAAATVAIVTFDRAGFVEDQLADAFTDRQYDTFVHVEIVDFERDTIDVAWVYPAGVKTNRHAITTPAAARLHFAGAAVRADSDEFMCVRKDTLARTQDDDWMIFGDVCE